MKHYLKVHIEGPYVSDNHDRYEELEDYLDEDGDVTYSDSELLSHAQDMVNQFYTWGHEVVTEDQVPEGER